jgi:hypothetical protein
MGPFSFSQHGCQSTTALVSDDELIAASFPDGHIAAASVTISPIAVIVIGAIIAMIALAITALAITAVAAVWSDTHIKLSERDCRFRSGRSGHLSGESRKSPQSARSSNDYRQFSHLDLLLPTLLLPTLLLPTLLLPTLLLPTLLLPTLPQSTNKSPICSLHRNRVSSFPAREIGFLIGVCSIAMSGLMFARRGSTPGGE